MCDEEFGESSNNNENNNDAGRPFKKAKYVWQVKGKYHLKPTNQQQQSLQETNNCNDNDITMRDENVDEICPNSTCVDRLLARTEAILDAMTSDDEDQTTTTTTNRNIERSISNEIPITLVTPNQQFNQDYYLNKWQARQMARSYIDNTINSVLETWVTAPFDAEDFVDNCDDDGHIEDEGIMMAIKSHGLQSTKTLNKKDNNNSSNNNSNSNSNNNASLAFLRPDELAENALEKFDSIESEVIKNGLESKLVPDEATTIIDDHVNGNNNHNGQTYKTNDENCMDINNYPVDILNAAILVAIERKGLSSA